MPAAHITSRDSHAVNLDLKLDKRTIEEKMSEIKRAKTEHKDH